MKAAAIVASLFVTALPGSSVHAVDVLASRYDDGRTGANVEERILTPASVNRDDFGLLFQYDVKDDVYAQPLLVSDLDITGLGHRNVVYVATVQNDMFAFDADGPAADEDGVLWTRHLGDPERITDIITDGGDGNVRKGGALGIMGTPVIDRERGILFFVSRQRRLKPHRESDDDDPYVFAQKLYALDIRSGRDMPGSPLEIKNTQGSIAFNPRIQNQRAGLARSGQHVVIAWGAHQDERPYVGWVMSYRYDGAGFHRTGSFVTTAAGDPNWPRISYFCLGSSGCALGGIWQSGRAPAVDSRGRILLFVGNGHNNTADDKRDKTSYGNAFVVLDPATLAVADFFTPRNVDSLNLFDLDLGGSGPMIVPDPNRELVMGGGKEGRMYVWDLGTPGAASTGSALGGFSATDAGVVQEFWTDDPSEHKLEKHIPVDIIGVTSIRRAGHIMGGPVYWSGPDGGRLYNWSEDSELRAYPVDPSAAIPVDTPSPVLGPIEIEGHPGGILTLSADGSRRGSGIVWASTYDASPERWPTPKPGDEQEGALHELKPGILRAFNAEDITRELWNSNMNPNEKLKFVAKFSPPTVASGRVYMSTFGFSPEDGKLKVYGLRNHHYLRPDEVRALEEAAARARVWWETMSPLVLP